MIRILLLLIILLVSGCASLEQTEETDLSLEENAQPLPSTCEGAIEAIASELDEDSINTLKETKREDLIMFHFSWGMGIRNGYGLWSENSPIRISCANLVGEDDIHPDNASGIIMDGVWELINESNM